MTTGSVSRLEQGWSITAQRTLKYEVTFVPGLITSQALVLDGPFPGP